MTLLPTIHRSESAEEALCDDLIARIAGREGVVRLSQRRASNVTLGLPDRRYRVHGTAFFWEVKTAAPASKLSAAQRDFLRAELSAGCLAGCGTLEDLADYVAMLVESRDAGRDIQYHWRHKHCADLVDCWTAKGMRP